jgi:hypothetical protein
MSLLLLVPGTAFAAYVTYLRLTHGPVNATSVLTVVFLLVSGIQFGLFAMFFDMEVNKDLR